MKVRLLCLLTVLCVMLSVVPVSAAEAPAMTMITQPAPLTVVTKDEISGKPYVNARASDGSELSSGVEPVRSEAATAIVGTGPVTITITGQPQEAIEQIKGQGRWLLKVYARVSANVELSYQWYSNTVKDNNSGTPVPGATKDVFEIPTDLEGGSYYYYCKLSAPGAESVCTNVTTVTVKVKILDKRLLHHSLSR